MACTSLVAAKSGTKGKLRPLQTGTTLRRLVGATVVAHDKENLRQTVGQAQFAIAEPAGTELMGHTMQALMEAMGDLARLQLDCTNAFGDLSREKCLQALHNKMPHLLAFEAQWLTQPTRAISRNEKGDTVEFRITAGLDQGDPFSPVAFAATLPLGELQNAILQAQRVARIGRAVSGCFSFLDDLNTGGSTHGGRKRKTAGEGKTGSSRSETEHDQVHDVHAITRGAARYGGLVGTNNADHTVLRRKAWKQTLKAWERCFQQGKNPGRLRRNCENQDSDGARTIGTTNCESTTIWQQINTVTNRK